MGKEEGTHTEPGHGAPPESDTSKVDQPERRNPTTGNETPKQFFGGHRQRSALFSFVTLPASYSLQRDEASWSAVQVPSTPKTQAPVSPKAGAYFLERSASARPADLPSTAPRAGNYDVWARVSMPDKRQLKGDSPCVSYWLAQ
jgi:hypothetical protein